MQGQDFLIIAANAILFIHFLYVTGVVAGQILIVIGGLGKFRFVRRPLWRFVHLGMILLVAALDVLDRPCPLTVWENQLRDQAGQLADWEQTFVERLLRQIVFLPLPEAFYDHVYVGFAFLVIVCLILVPPRRGVTKTRKARKEPHSR